MLRRIDLDLVSGRQLDKDWLQRLVVTDAGSDGALVFIYQSSSNPANQYEVVIKRHSDGSVFAKCTCPFGVRSDGQFCKHVYAAYNFSVIEGGVLPAKRKSLDVALAEDSFRPKVPTRNVFWPSKMDMTEKCPASRVGSKDIDIVIDPIGSYAVVGQTVHDIITKVISGEITSVTPEISKEWAVKWGVEESGDDIFMLSQAAYSAWFGSSDEPGLRKYFDAPKCENQHKLEIEAKNPHTNEDEIVVISGRIDVEEVTVMPPESRAKVWAVALDWKTGRKADDAAYKAQMLSYAKLLTHENPEIDLVTTIIVWLRDRTYSIVSFNREEIDAWFNSFIRRYAFWDGRTYNPGDHCSWCKRFYDCPARIKSMNSMVGALVEAGERSLIHDESGALVDPDKLYSAYMQAKTLSRMIDAFLDQLKEETIARGGIKVPSLGGKRGFSIRKTSGKTIIDPLKSWEVIQNNFTDEEIAAMITISVSALKEKAMAKVGRGMKKAHYEMILDLLTKAEAINKTKPSNVFEIGDIEDVEYVEESDKDG